LHYLRYFHLHPTAVAATSDVTLKVALD